MLRKWFRGTTSGTPGGRLGLAVGPGRAIRAVTPVSSILGALILSVCESSRPETRIERSIGDVLHEERDPDQRPPFVEVVSPQADRHYVKRLDVAQGPLRLTQRTLHSIVRTGG